MTHSSVQRLTFKRRDWFKMVVELEKRGQGRRESGAFLLGHYRKSKAHVRRVAYYDDLEPGSLDGAISLSHRAYSRLSSVCSKERLKVLGDIHTHPGKNIEMSSIDKEHPLISVDGHLALILPFFAQGKPSLKAAAVYEYFNGMWKCRTGCIRYRWLRR